MSGRMLRTSFFVTCVCLLPVLAQAQKAVADYDKEVDFSKFKTYAWQSGQPAPSPLTHKRIVTAIDEQLASKGMTQVESSPSAIIVYYAAVEEQKRLNAWGSGPRWSGFGTVTAETIRVGQLVVDIYDAATKQLVWRGSVSDTASDKPETNQKKIKEAIAKLFKQFPPAQGRNSD